MHLKQCRGKIDLDFGMDMKQTFSCNPTIAAHLVVAFAMLLQSVPAQSQGPLSGLPQSRGQAEIPSVVESEKLDFPSYPKDSPNPLVNWTSDPVGVSRVDLLEAKLNARVESGMGRSPQTRQMAMDLAGLYLQAGRWPEAAWALEEIGEYGQAQLLMDHTEHSLKQVGQSDNMQAIIKYPLEDQLEDPRAERWAYLLDRLLGINLVPPTVLLKNGNEIFSVQYKVADTSETHRSFIRNPYFFAPYGLYVLDFVMMNGDRNGGNTLFRRGKRWVAIDHGQSHIEPADTSRSSAIQKLFQDSLPQHLRSYDSRTVLSIPLAARIQQLTEMDFHRELKEIPLATRRRYWQRLLEIKAAIGPVAVRSDRGFSARTRLFPTGECQGLLLDPSTDP